jgi:hypothetical protein
MSAAVQTLDGALILDSHKLSYHTDRVAAWEAGERIAPVSVDMSPDARVRGPCARSAMP